jgi:hypothetical protein
MMLHFEPQWKVPASLPILFSDRISLTTAEILIMQRSLSGLLCSGIIVLGSTFLLWAQEVPMADLPATVTPKTTPAKKGEEKKKEEAEPPVVRRPKVVLPPQYMMLRLQDGSSIAGDLSIKEIQVTTEFGVLTVPIAKLKSFTPGLDSNKRAAETLQAKIKDLASDDYKTRELAHKDLAAMGPKISAQLAPHLQSENAEVKRHITEIMKEFEEQAAEEEDEDGNAKTERPWIKLDTIETTEFTVLGSIAPAEFKMSSKYGPLTIALGDVTRAERPTDAVAEEIRKTVSVPGQNLIQKSAKNTGIRVNAGDKITITATGSIVMTPWGGNAQSGPDGMPNYGWYMANTIPGGALVGRIGDKGTVFKIGSKHSFVAKTSGTLQLAIGMIADYANDSYNYPGEYKVKIKVDPQ